jgi:hypothetical protein
MRYVKARCLKNTNSLEIQTINIIVVNITVSVFHSTNNSVKPIRPTTIVVVLKGVAWPLLSSNNITRLTIDYSTSSYSPG